MSIRTLIRPASYLRCCAIANPNTISGNALIIAASFSTTPAPSFPRTRSTRDRNPARGISPIHRRPQKEPLSVSKLPIPEPVEEERHNKIITEEDHGLWGFFREGKALPKVEEDRAHGRAWTVEELRHKSWEDLHKLWWVCVKERNILATQELERNNIGKITGEEQAKGRKIQIKLTQRGIKHVLTERYYAWGEAKKIAATDPEVNLSGEGPAYVPGSYSDSEPTQQELLEESEIYQEGGGNVP